MVVRPVSVPIPIPIAIAIAIENWLTAGNCCKKKPIHFSGLQKVYMFLYFKPLSKICNSAKNSSSKYVRCMLYLSDFFQCGSAMDG